MFSGWLIDGEYSTVTVARKIVGLLILIFAAAPLLSSVIWAAGVSQAIFGDEFLAGIPQEIVSQVPGFVDEAYEAAQEPGAVTDEDARGWLTAAAKVGKTPSQVLEEIGVYEWLETEVQQTLDDVNGVLKGEEAATKVKMDLRKLKEALAHPAMRDYLASVLKKLPNCTRPQLEEWKKSLLNGKNNGHFPPCDPGKEIPQVAMDSVVAFMVDIPDETPVFQGSDVPTGLNLPGLLSSFVWLLFIFPGLLTVVGAAVAGNNLAEFLRWTGIGTIAGGFFPLVSTSAARTLALAFVKFDPGAWNLGEHSQFWTSAASQALARRATDLAGMVIDQLFTPVTDLAVVVCGLGVILVVLSFVVGGGRKQKQN